jgi:hypothetical protein
MTPTSQPTLIGNPNNHKRRRSYRDYIVILIIVVSCIGSLFLGYSSYRLYQDRSMAGTTQQVKPIADINTNSTREKDFKEIVPKENPPALATTPAPVQAPPKVLTPTEQDTADYKVYAAGLKNIVTEQDPKVALYQIVKDQSQVKVVETHCHSLTHVIGNEALIKYDNNIQKAMEYYVDTCGGGYIHGLVEKYLKVSQNPEVEIYNLCPGFNDGICVHGLGHGLMLMNKLDIPKSVDGCKKLPGGAQVACAEGVFMENFDSENADDTDKPYLYPEHPTTLCEDYTGGYKNACYYYSGRYIFKVVGEPYKALAQCTVIEETNNKITCVRGMSAGILRSDLYHPGKMEDYCNSVPIAKSNCLEGAVNYHLLMLNDENLTRTTMCDTFVDLANRNLCNTLVTNSPFRN